MLLALREAGQVLSSTLESEEIVTRLLEIMRSVAGLTAAVISRFNKRATCASGDPLASKICGPGSASRRKPRRPPGGAGGRGATALQAATPRLRRRIPCRALPPD